MTNIKSHIVFSKQQRYGIFLLVLIIVLLQVAFYFSYNNESVAYDVLEYELANKELDSIKKELKVKTYKIYPFNPNYITDYKGYSLGMSTDEIDRLLAFRKENKWVNSTNEFQKVTKVSDSLLNKIAPYFKFPDWVTKSNRNQFKTTYKKKSIQKFNLNTATTSQLETIYGIGPSFSKRIINYREKNNGFASYVELGAIYGLSPETITKVKESTIIINPREVVRFNLNNVTRNQLVTIPSIDYELAFNIIEYRSLNVGFKSVEELLKVSDFPSSKFEIIKLSLFVE